MTPALLVAPAARRARNRRKAARRARRGWVQQPRPRSWRQYVVESAREPGGYVLFFDGYKRVALHGGWVNASKRRAAGGGR